MKLTHIFTVAACCLSVACNRQTAEKPAPKASPKSSTEVTVKLPSLDEAVDKLKADVKDVAEAAKEKLAENAEVEIERIAKQLDEVAGDFNTNAGQLEGDAKEQFEKMRVEFDRKKEVFRQKLKEFKEGSEDARAELLKGLYDSLAEMKSALDRAAEAFRQSAPPAESKPS